MKINEKIAAEKMGRDPINPIGSCFDSTAHQVIAWIKSKRTIGKVCHGVGVANLPGQEGLEIGHAWLEENGVAYDTTWGIAADANAYREQLKVKHVVEYHFGDFMLNWISTDFPGPWDEKIKIITDKKGGENNEKQ